MSQHNSLDLTKFSIDDLEAMLLIVERYEPDAAELAESGEIRFDVSPVGSAGYRRR